MNKMDNFKECKYQDLNNWFLCDKAIRKPNDIYYNSGHPCKHAIQDILGKIYCSIDFIKIYNKIQF